MSLFFLAANFHTMKYAMKKYDHSTAATSTLQKDARSPETFGSCVQIALSSNFF